MANNIRVLIQKPVDGSSSGVQSVTGDGVNNTDPLNPVLAFPNADEVDDTTTTNKFATGTNTGDETTATIKSKRPIKTVNGSTLEGAGNVVTPDTTYTDAEIKTKYEANANTNAFTDANVTKLNGVETGAEVNTINSKTVGEPTGSDVILNTVSLTQAEYDAGTPIATTLYIITDA